jgi:hypothetical protein
MPCLNEVKVPTSGDNFFSFCLDASSMEDLIFLMASILFVSRDLVSSRYSNKACSSLKLTRQTYHLSKPEVVIKYPSFVNFFC